MADSLRRRSLIQPLERRVLLNAGELDPSFSGDGKATILGNPSFSAVDVAVQASGKTLVVGLRAGKFAVARYDLAGNLDPTFGEPGVGYAFADFSQDNPNFPSATPAAMAVQPADGKIVVVGTWALGVAIARFTADGVLDPTFGGDGRVIDYPTDDPLATILAKDVAIQANGRIVVAVSVRDGDSDFGVARYLDNGSLDNSFSGDGVQVVGFGVDDQPDALTIDASGRIVVVGYSASETNFDLQFAVARLTTSGNLDGSFSGDGKVLSRFTGGTLYSSATGVVVQPTGKIVIAGEVGSADFNDHDMGLFRLNDNGTGDPSFGLNNGQAVVDFGAGDRPESLMIGQAGQLIVGGSRRLTPEPTAPRRMTVACLTENGLLDTAFAGDGKQEIDFGKAPAFPSPKEISASAKGLALGLNGTIVAAGGEQFATARLFDRRFATISIGTFGPQMFEQGAVGTSFFVTRTERLPTPTRVFISTGGTARPPNTFPVRPRDYNGTGISFGDGQTSSTFVDIPANETFVAVTITPVDDALVEGDETAIFSIAPNAAYDASASRSTTLVIRDNDIVAGPTVTEAAFLFETAPQQLTFRFNQNVAGSLTASDLILTGPAGVPGSQFVYDSITNTATYSLDAILPDGNYEARFAAASVTNGNGTPMPADFAFPFFVLAGDANRDRTVNFADLVILAQNYNTVGKTFSQGNFNYSADGSVDFADLVLLAQRYNTSLPLVAPAGLISAATKRPVRSLPDQLL